MSKMVIVETSKELRKKVAGIASHAMKEISVVGFAPDFVEGLRICKAKAADYLFADVEIADFAQKSPQWPSVINLIHDLTIRLVLFSGHPISERGHTKIWKTFVNVDAITPRMEIKERDFSKLSKQLSDQGIYVMSVKAEALQKLPVTPLRKPQTLKTAAVRSNISVEAKRVETLQDRLLRRQATRPRIDENHQKTPHPFSVEVISDFVLEPERLSSEQIQQIELELLRNPFLAKQVNSLRSKRPFLIGRHTSLFDV